MDLLKEFVTIDLLANLQLGHNVVDLLDEHIHLADELDQSLRHQNNTKVFACLGPLNNNLNQFFDQLLEGGFVGMNFLTNEGVGWPGQ